MLRKYYPFLSFLFELGPADFVHEKVAFHVGVLEFAANSATRDADEDTWASLFHQDAVFKGDNSIDIKSSLYFIRDFNDGGVGEKFFEDVDDVNGPNECGRIFNDDYFAFI